jgi:trans-aconitate methyltransferase
VVSGVACSDGARVGSTPTVDARPASRSIAATETASTYTFGDTPQAAARLALVARVFDPTTRALLAVLPGRRSRVLDLGCGPGHTTRLLVAAFPRAAVLGLDRSEPFLAEARRTAPPGATFRAADVTRAPLPGSPADLLLARLVLEHLPDRAGVLRTWASALAPGGTIVVEDPEAIETADPDLRTYLDVAGGLIAHGGGDLYVGRELDALAADAGLAVVHSATVDVTPTTGEAATLFASNLAVWRDAAWVRATVAPATLDALAAAFDGRRARTDRGVIRWRIHQAVLA